MKKILAFMLAAVTIAACNKHELEPSNEAITVTITIENSAAVTKA